jgi:hypothetical protein
MDEPSQTWAASRPAGQVEKRIHVGPTSLALVQPELEAPGEAEDVPDAGQGLVGRLVEPEPGGVEIPWRGDELRAVPTPLAHPGLQRREACHPEAGGGRPPSARGGSARPAASAR